MTLDAAAIRALPKVVLHDHLDGGLRPHTLIELASEIGYELPTTNADELGSWFQQAADSGDLVQYLETFAHTCAVMQTVDGLRRVAREAAIDLAADGVVYAEQRYAPEQHLERGLSLQEVVDAVQEGFDEGVAQAARDGQSIVIGTLITAMRQNDRGDEIAALAVANRDRGVVGFDIAGPEFGFPADDHASAFTTLRENFLPITIHAGEADGVDSIRDALQQGAIRLGHGVRIIEDVTTDASGISTMGEVATWVRDRQIPLEVSPSSNLQTGIASTIAEHPITTLRDLGFAITINTDNRLMSATSMSREMELLVTEAGWTLEDLADATLTAASSGFAEFEIMEQIIGDHILPGYSL